MAIVEQVHNVPVASGVDTQSVTKEQLASAISSLADSVNEFVNIASPLLVELASERKEKENAASGQ